MADETPAPLYVAHPDLPPGMKVKADQAGKVMPSFQPPRWQGEKRIAAPTVTVFQPKG